MCFSSFSYLFRIFFDERTHVYCTFVWVMQSSFLLHCMAYMRTLEIDRLEDRDCRSSSGKGQMSLAKSLFLSLTALMEENEGIDERRAFAFILMFFFLLLGFHSLFITLSLHTSQDRTSIAMPSSGPKLLFRLTHILTEECTKNLNVFANTHLCAAFRSLAAEKKTG